MPENTRFSDEDKDLILQILDPLNKNPARYETLNEMAKVRRDIVGEPHPEFEEEEEELVEEVSSPVDFTEEEEVPEFKDFDDEDIDELLNYDPDKPGGGLTPKTKDEEIVIEPDDSSPEIDIPDSPFSDLGTPDSGTEDDPFADMGLGDEDSTPPVVDDEDPFASLEDLPISDSSEVDTTEDPFADNENLFDSFDSPGKDSISPVSDTDAFDDFGADLGDFDANTDSDIDTTDTLAGASLEDDLSSLAEGEPVEEDELSDEELAIIQQEIISYPPRLKRTIIDTITNDRVSNNDQRALLELIKARQKPAEVAEFLSTVLGRKVELYDSSGLYSEDGVQVIAKDEIYTKEGEFRRRQLIKKTVLGVAAGFLLIFGLFSSYKYVIKPYQASSKYEMGLEEIQKAWREPRNTKLRKEHLLEAERYFAKGEEIIPNNLEYLNKFGIAYMKIGEYDRAFEKLFGKIEPDLGSNNPEMAWNKREKIPLLSFSGYYSWDDDRLPIAGKKPENDKDPMRVLVDRSTIERRVLKAGAYLVAALEKKMYHNDTFINLARFHSNPARLFSKDGVKYKNDVLAVDYYQNVFTFGGDPDNIEATAGLGKIYYNQKDYGASLSYYDKIYEKFPNNPVGHEGLLSNYIEMWKNDHNPRFVMNHHRQVMNVLNVEDELSLFILSKLAGFYIDLNPSNIRIKYSLNPEDQVTGMDIDDVTNHLLNVAFTRTENRDGIKINGRNHAESYYQRGRFYLKRGESIRALKQFEYAASYDPAHYLAVLEMAEHYMRIGNTEESMNLLKNAAERYKRYHHYYGGRDEDETLINGEPGRIFFDIGKMIYMGSSSITEKDDLTAFPGRKVYPTRSLGELPNKDRDRRKEMKNAIAYFAKAEELKLKNPALLRELHYYKGWIEYMNSMTNEGFSEALKDWSRLEDDVYTNVNVIMGKANAYYYTGQLKAALGNYLKLKEDFEEKMGDIATPVPQDNRHQEVFQTLSAIYNNIGAIYERQGKFNLAMQHYWKAIETSRMISTASEIAMANKEMLFRKKIGGDGLPLLDDWLPPTLESVVEIQNIRKK